MIGPRVKSLEPSTLDLLDGGSYDAVLASLGFEQRCREIPAALGPGVRRAAIPFLDRRRESYAENERFFSEHGWELPEIDSERAAVAWMADWVKRNGADPEVRRIAVDVSSMSRVRIATVIEVVVDYLAAVELEVDFLYTPSSFLAPDPTDDPPVLSVQPVTGYFAGWWNDLDAPLHAIIGVGYELERASSAIDQLEPEAIEVFIPLGTDKQYLTALRKANDELFNTQNIKPVTEYEVADPFTCFRMLESRVHGIAGRKRVALVPLGPKIFATCVMLVAALHPGAVQVIRVSAAEREHTVDYHSDGNVYGLQLVLGRPREESETRSSSPESSETRPSALESSPGSGTTADLQE